MPKGVEHTVQTDLHTNLDSVESLMPKGVEHAKTSIRLLIIWLSVESLMPKGVEHPRNVQTRRN